MKDFDELVSFIHSIKSNEELGDFLYGLTTEKERKELVGRVEIVKRLLAGEAQHKIASDMGVGVATVTRGSKEITNGRFKALRKQL